MRRYVWIGLAVAIMPWIVIGAVRALQGDDARDGYYVRAIFDNASTIVPGEDVKIAGVPVGSISDMDVTEDKRAAITLRIDDENFIPWKRDASCTIRAQGLIGEKFVECKPGSSDAEDLATIEDGPGEGERLLPVQNTSSPVDLDLVNNILRLPYRQRFQILLSEFGTALAGRGADLNEVIHRANPALRETDKVLKILADQNRELAALASNADEVLAPLAREKEAFADFIVQAGDVAEASAQRRGDIRRGIALLPGFLAELRPLMADLEGFADQGTPLLADLNEAAPDLGRLIRAQGTLASAGRESFPSLGDSLERGRPALIRARPLFDDLNRLGRQLAPVSVDLDDLTSSLDETGGVPRINDFLYYLALSTNGFDDVGHYLRAGLVTNLCTTYATSFSAGCSAKFTGSSAASASADPLGPRNAAPAPAGSRASGGSVPPGGGILNGLLGRPDAAAGTREREQNMQALRSRAQGQSPALGESEPVLDYLLGGESR